MKSLQEHLGAFYGWLWNEFEGIYFWTLLYWPARNFERRFSQIASRVVKGVWAGFMSEARGLSWDRKSRYGKK